MQVTLISPQEYYGDMVEVVKERRGADLEVQYLDDGSVLLTSLIPWQEVVCEMNDQVVELVSESVCLRFCPPTTVRLSTRICDHTKSANTSARKTLVMISHRPERFRYNLIACTNVSITVYMTFDSIR